MRNLVLPVLYVELNIVPGYSSFRGQVLNSTDLADIIGGLRDNNLLGNYSHILTGK